MATATTSSLVNSHICAAGKDQWRGNASAPAAAPPVRKCFSGLRSTAIAGLPSLRSKVQRGRACVVCAVGDVSPEGTTYLIAGAIAIAVIGTAYPLLFSRKDLCPECDGAGFVRKTGSALAANAARKDSPQIVCKRCNGLGKLGQVDK